jgi:peroxiredoxin Q/BCP
MRGRIPFAAPLALAAFGAPAVAQDVAAPQQGTPLAVGVEAPDFTLPAATRDGVSPQAARLMDFRGQTVVLAFFFRARTSG